MIRLLKIEWFKLRGYRAFWILAGLYALSLTGVLVASKLFVDTVAEKGGDLGRIALETRSRLLQIPGHLGEPRLYRRLPECDPGIPDGHRDRQRVQFPDGAPERHRRDRPR